MKHLVMGTAGHIDHGKTRLIKALTGIDTDTLEEEKRRGISINLGYAFYDLKGGTRIGIVDVPGHMRFIKTMLAGVAGIDFVLFVVAADDSVMPQTREHFNILRLLGIRKGIIAVTKTDLVETEMADLVAEEARELVKGSFLEDAPLIKVSAQTGEGVAELKAAVEELVLSLEARQAGGIFRLPVDRAFTVQGFGTVVTGTIFSGGVEQGDPVIIFPSALKTEVRGIEVHKTKTEKANTGQRTALNLSGISKQEVKRGDVICDPGYYRPSYMLDCRVTLISGVKSLRQGEYIKFHLGTSEVDGRFYHLGKKHLVQIRLNEPLIAVRDDRFIIRNQGSTATLGGGVVIDVHPQKHKRRKNIHVDEIESMAQADIKDLIQIEIKKARSVLSVRDISETLTLKKKTVKTILESLAGENALALFKTGRETFCLAAQKYKRLVQLLLSQVKAFHDKNPMMHAGINKMEIRQVCESHLGEEATAFIFAGLWEKLVAGPDFKEVAGTLALAAWEVVSSEASEKLKRGIYRLFNEGRFSSPSRDEVLRMISNRKARQALDALLEEKKLVSIESHIFTDKTLEDGKDLIMDFLQKKGSGTVSELRQVLNTSRKYALPLLHYYESQGFLLREGDRRVLA
jgi:selenocysteine-specific elongation factor